MQRNNEIIIKFYNDIISTQENLTAKSISRIATYMGHPYSFITWKRKDLYKYIRNAEITDYLSDILSRMDMMNKNFLPFRFWGKDHIDMFTRFLANDKHEINDINKYLCSKYVCVLDGDCNGCMAFSVLNTFRGQPVSMAPSWVNIFLQPFPILDCSL